MSPYFWDKFWDLVVNLVSIILGGGAIVAYIEWRRYQREQRVIEREEEKVAIDVVNAEISDIRWEVHERMKPETKVRIYENKLEGTVREYTILVEFVLRNTTNTELVITELQCSEAGLPKRPYELRKSDVYEIFDLPTGEYKGVKLDDLVKLEPRGSLGRAIWIERSFDERQKLETPPSTVTVQVKTSEGRVVDHNIPLRPVEWISQANVSPGGYPYYGRAKKLPPRVQRLERGERGDVSPDLPIEEIPF